MRLKSNKVLKKQIWKIQDKVDLLLPESNWSQGSEFFKRGIKR